MVTLSQADQNLITQKQRYIENTKATLPLFQVGGATHTQLLASIKQAEEYIQSVQRNAEFQAKVDLMVGPNASSLDRSMAGLALWIREELKPSREDHLRSAVEKLCTIQDDDARLEYILGLPEDIQEDAFQMVAYAPERDGR